MNTITNRITFGTLAFFGLFALAFVVATPAQAADLPGYEYGGWSTDYYQDYYEPTYNDYGGWSTDYYQDYYEPSYEYGGWSTDYYQDYYTPSYSSGYSSGFSPSYFGGSSSCGSCKSSYGGYSYMPSTPSYFGPSDSGQYQEQSSYNSNQNNSSVGPITNTNIVTVNVPAQQTPTYNKPHYPTYPTYPVQPQVPYVTLSAVPYTGLELGPVGTALYWTFLVLWSLFAAYLIVVKRVQTKIVAWFNRTLFGEKQAQVEHKATPAVAHAAHVAPAVKPLPSADDLDPFIASQINRA